MSTHLSYSCTLFLTITCLSVGLWHHAVHTSFCLLFCICMPVYLPIRHIHTHNAFHMCLCVCLCVHMSVYHVHSYVSMCLSATFMYTIRPFRTFLRLSVDLRVFVYVYFHVNILHVQLFVRLFVCVCKFSFVSVTFICTMSLHTCPDVCLSVLCPTQIFCLDFFLHPYVAISYV